MFKYVCKVLKDILQTIIIMVICVIINQLLTATVLGTFEDSSRICCSGFKSVLGLLNSKIWGSANEKVKYTMNY